MRTPIQQLTLLQAMKLVVLCAAAFACIAPMVHLWQAGVARGAAVVLFESVVVPLVLATLAFPLLRRGPGKEYFIRLSLLCSISFALGFAVYSFGIFTLPTFWNSHVDPRDRTGLAGLATHIVAILALSAGFAVLMRGLVRKPSARTQA